MAGTITVNGGAGVALNGFAFANVAEYARTLLEADGVPGTSASFEPMDEGGMSFITLEHCDRDLFIAFHRVARRGRDDRAWADRGYLPVWEELLRAMEADERFAGGSG